MSRSSNESTSKRVKGFAFNVSSGTGSPVVAVMTPPAPGLINWLYNDGRMAVQVFLVGGGFLAAGSLVSRGVVNCGF
jgi:hypothetical protein